MPLLPAPRDLVTVHRASTEFEARTIRTVLEEAGLRVMLRSRVVPGYDVAAPPGVWGDVLVRVEDEARARVLVAAYLESLDVSEGSPL